jgi:predicted phosphoadenosine phosphosulfate sulfurtransferase
VIDPEDIGEEEEVGTDDTTLEASEGHVDAEGRVYIPKTRKQKFTDVDTLTAGLERMRYLYDISDHIVVSFSGGKDSTAVLHLALKVAAEKNRLPVHAIFFDEEAIHPPTIEYVDRVRQRGDVKLEWFCLPITHRNACSNEKPWWKTWDPTEKHLWVREAPAHGIFTHPKFVDGMGVPEFGPEMFDKKYGNVICVQGIRAAESLRRRRIVCQKKNDNYIAKLRKGYWHAYPIYDWSERDVWKLVEEWQLDYNKTYDIYNRTNSLGGALAKQRVCPPFGEEPLRGLHIYAECFPEMWHKMCNRLPGVATAARYANTELYGIRFSKTKPPHLTWKEYAYIIAGYYEGDLRDQMLHTIDQLCNLHKKHSDLPMEDETENLWTGYSWRYICKILQKGDLKDRTKANASVTQRLKWTKMGLTASQVQTLYGKRKPSAK